MFFPVGALANPWRFLYTGNPSLQSGSNSIKGWRKIQLHGWLLCLGFVTAGCVPSAFAQHLYAGVSAPSSWPALDSVVFTSAAPPRAVPRPRGALYGTVVDSNGGVIAGASVALAGPVSRNVASGGIGGFSFTGLPPGTYSIKVSGAGMKATIVPNVILRPGGVRFLPPITLQVSAASTSVEVYANPEQLAEEQLQLQMHQRVMGFLPNYFSSYDWNAVHLWPKQKFELGYRSEIDPVTVAIIAGEAGVDQYYDRFPGYGGGLQGYGKRFGADYATAFIGTMIGDAALPTLFHQDPRYFYKGTGSFSSRAGYALSRALIVRGDNKHWQFAYSRILGDLAAGAISNIYYPPSDRGTSLVFESAGIDLGANAATNVIREFILPGLTSHVPKGIKEKAPIHF